MNYSALISNIFDKVCLIAAFSLIANCLNQSGILDKAGLLTSHMKHPRNFIVVWYCIAFILSGFFNDMTIAALIIPIALQYAERVNFKEKEILLTTIAFGISSGGDLTVFGGNDNLSALGLLQGTQYEFTKAQWTSLFIIPTILIGCLALIVCIRLVNNIEWAHTKTAELVDVKIDYVELIVSILMIYAAFHVRSYILLLAAGLISIIYKNFNIKLIPFRALGIWTLAFVIGKIIGVYVPKLEITNAPLLFLALIIGTNIFTNTALMSAAIPILISANVPIFMCYGAIKAINVAYLSIYGNACYSVASGYGISQKKLFKNGLPVVVGSYIIILIYFLIVNKVM